MSSDPRCREIEARLTDAFLARREPDVRRELDVQGEQDLADAQHAEGCAQCARTRLELAMLTDRLSAAPAAELSDARAGQVLRAATRELSAAPVALPPPTQLAPGFGRELGRLLAFAVIPVPLLVLWYAAVVHFGGALLAEWLPGFLVVPIGVAFGIGAASWLGLVYASIPVVAHRRTRRLQEEIA